MQKSGSHPRYKMHRASGVILQVILLPTIEMVRFLGATFLLLFSHIVVAIASIILDNIEKNEVRAGRAVITVCPDPVKNGEQINSTNTHTHSMYSAMP